MTVAKYVQTNFNTDTATNYKTEIDNNFSVILGAGSNFFAPYAQSSPNMTIQLAAGSVYDGVTITSVAAQNTGTITAPSVHDRIDRVVIDRFTGVFSVITGSENVSPTPPAITSGKIPVAQILLHTATATITNALITDERQLAALGRGTAGEANTGTSSGTIPLFGSTGNLTGLTTLDVNVSLTGIISPTSIAADQDNYNPSGLSTASTLRLTSGAAYNITGLQGGATGRLITIYNIGSFNLTFKANSSSSTASNRFNLAADVVIVPKGALVLLYDATTSLWVAISSPSASGAPVVTSNKIVFGAVTYQWGTGTVGTPVVFPTAFSGTPVVTCNATNTTGGVGVWSVNSLSSTGFTAYSNITPAMNWMAIGAT